MKVTEKYLSEYRQANRFIAAHRDDGMCPLCESSASESDHVLGRGTRYSLLKEHWTLRMALCQKCHHQKHHGSKFDMVKQVMLLKEANDGFVESADYNNAVMVIRLDLRIEIIKQTEGASIFLEDWLAKNG